MPKQSTKRPETDPQFSLEVDAEVGLKDRPGWGMGRTKERARALKGHVRAVDARKAAAAFPECLAVHGRGTDTEKRRPSADMHCAGTTLDLDCTGEGYGWGEEEGVEGVTLVRIGDPLRGALPDGTLVAGTWGEVGRAFGEWMCAHRPEFVCARAESVAYGAAVLAWRARELEELRVAAGVAVDRARAALARTRAASDALGPFLDDLDDDTYDAVCGVLPRVRAEVAACEAAYDAGGARRGAVEAAVRAEQQAAALGDFAERCGVAVPAD